MTRNEAIAELVRIWHSPHLDLILKAGLGEVIEALKGADGDLISRQDAIEAVENNSYGMGSRASVKAIKALPSAEARPTGEWKEVYAETDYRNGWIEFSCECCEYQHGLESGEYGWSYGEPIPWKFCPLCGAKMYKDGEDE